MVEKERGRRLLSDGAFVLQGPAAWCLAFALEAWLRLGVAAACCVLVLVLLLLLFDQWLHTHTHGMAQLGTAAQQCAVWHSASVES